MADILLKTEHLSKSFGGVKAVQDFNMELHEGEVGGIIGPNGAGKTTIFNLLSHIYDYSEGRVTFLGRDITESDQVQVARMGLSRTFQNTRLFAGLSVLDNDKVGLDQAGRYNLFEAMFLLPRRQREERRIAEEASRCLEVLNLSQHSGARQVRELIERQYELFPRLRERRGQDAGTLSGGEQQMLAIGRGLMGRPRLLLLDEPSLGLAPIIVGEVFDTIRRIRDEGITVILVEQNAKKSLSICDYAYVLENGRMVKSGPGRQMLDDPDIAAAYLGVREE